MNKKKIQKPDSIEIPEIQMESLARVLLPIIREYALSEEGQREYNEWQKQQFNNKDNDNKNHSVSSCNQQDN